MEFKPGPAKPARAVRVSELKAAIANGAKPTGAKTVGGGTVLVYFPDINFYLSDGRTLREVLQKVGIEP